MKKIMIFFVAVLMTNLIFAQAVPKAPSTESVTNQLKNFVQPPAIGDVGKTTGSIVDKLMGGLSLGADKKSSLTSAISGFLKNKEGILGLAKTDPSQYLSKFNPMQKGLFSKLKGIVGATAFTKFLGMKPSGNNIAGDVLSNLFF